jgi:ABC-type Mn2+/Zn2+ transport system ATPase subunit
LRRLTVLATVADVAAGYGGRPVIEDVSFELATGERVGVLGPNGGGKTTLFRVLLGELPPLRGHVDLAGGLGYVPQTERSQLDFPVSALDVALMGTLSRTAWWQRPSRADRELARRSLARVGLEDAASTQFGELSGGQRQRVLVARALVQDAPILLFDEPFTGVDIPSAHLLEELLVELASEGRGILIATHDLEQVEGWDRVLCLNRYQVAFGRPDQVLTRSVLEQTYGGAIVTLAGETIIVPPHHH